MPDPIAVNSMFGRIAGRYDLANHLLSGGLDFGWRRTLVAAVKRGNPSEVLDLATGSGDVAFALSQRLPTATKIIGMDFCQPMLGQAEVKKTAASDGRFVNVTFRQGDALALPFADATFDAITIAFGLRNLSDRAQGLREMRRVLRPGGRLLVLEFSKIWKPLEQVYDWYSFKVLPWLGQRVAGDADSYRYLAESIRMHPDQDELKRMMERAGLEQVEVFNLAAGAVALHRGSKY